MVARVKTFLSPARKTTEKTVVLRNALGQPLIFGMNWGAVVGGQPMKLARKRARRLRATHYLVTGTPATVAGCVQLEKQYFAQASGIFSAAALFSTAYPVGALACLVRFEEGGCWLVAAHAGSILAQTDRWFANLQAAQEALEPLRLRFPNLQVHQELATSSGALPVWLSEKCSESARLRVSQVAGSSLGVRTLLVAGLVVTAALAQWLYRAPAFDSHVRDENPTQRWFDVLNHYALQHPVHGFADLNRVLADWRRVPFDPTGWKLVQVQCEPVSFDWSCAAQYRRQHRFALNRHLEAVKPAAWTLHAVALDRASLVWSVSQAAYSLDLTQDTLQPDWMHTLQTLSPLFEHIQLGLAAKLLLTAPLDTQGQPIALPVALPNWQKRSLVFKGPLRSVIALQKLQMPVRWRSATLEVGNLSGQALTRSALVVQLIGDMFEHTHK